MGYKSRSRTVLRPSLLALVGVFLTGQAAFTRVLDNFDDNTKTDWADFTFQPGFGIPVETSGQFRFELPPAGQAIFTASQKTSETFELKEGRTVEFRVDVMQAGAKDSFAVLAFIPLTVGGSPNSPGSLAGYGFAKSTTDVLLTKGINKYFVADAGPTAQLRNDNITLVLTLTVKENNVIITGKALDKANNNALMWERTVVDRQEADVLDAGTDSPAAPFITTGYFTLYCYEDYSASAPEDPYLIYYDNAEVYVTDTTVLDDFNDNTKTAWADFTFQPGFGIPVETSGQFRFELPPAGQAIFTASQKTSRVFELKEGERLEFSVDIAQAGAKDSFAVLAFIPLTVGGSPNSPGSLAGYGFAKSTTDVLLTKGINKYFVADAGPTAQLRNDNITLVLTLTVKEGNVIITGKALDKANNNALMWERTVVDRQEADVLDAGTDSPAAPFITTGYFTLYCYEDYSASAPEDPYLIYYDNAVASAPPVAPNTPPILSEIQPADFANFLAASTQVSFKVSDDKPLPKDKITLTLNGQPPGGGTVTISNVDSEGKVVQFTLLNGLAPNVNYTAVLSAQDSEGETISRTLYFDTFLATDLVIEAEDYNFGGGQFIDNPVPIAEGSAAANSYSLQIGTVDVDYSDTRANLQNAPYRPDDHVRMQRSLDKTRQKYTDAGGAGANVFDYDVGDIASGEFLNYTRTFAAGVYEIYLRQAYANLAQGQAVLEKVTGDRTQPNQTTQLLGSFLGVQSGFQYRNIPLTDGLGQNRIQVRLSGVETVRLRQVTAEPADGDIFQNYLVFVPVPDPGVLRAIVTSVSPGPGTVETVAPVISVTIQNRDTSVRTNSIALSLNSITIASPTVAADTNGAMVTYAVSPLPPPGSTNAVRVVFTDSSDVTQTNEWSFTLNYKLLLAANRAPGTGNERGFSVRLVQSPQDSAFDNSLSIAEQQLAVPPAVPIEFSTNTTVQTINFTDEPLPFSSPYFPFDSNFPGIDPAVQVSPDYVAIEALTYLELPAGAHRFGVRSDDGFKLQSGTNLTDTGGIVLGFRTDGTFDGTFEFVAEAAGLYPFRFIYYETRGDAYVQLFSVDRTTGERTLINDTNTASSIKAYMSVSAPPVGVTILNPRFEAGNFAFSFQSVVGKSYTVQSSTDLSSWGGAGVGPFAGNGSALNISIPSPAASRTFYRVLAQ